MFLKQVGVLRRVVIRFCHGDCLIHINLTKECCWKLVESGLLLPFYQKKTLR